MINLLGVCVHVILHSISSKNSLLTNSRIFFFFDFTCPKQIFKKNLILFKKRIDQNADPLICKVNAQIRQLAIENENLTQDLFNTQQELKKERKLSLLAKNKAKEALESKIKTEIYLSKLPQASAVHNLNSKLEDSQKDCASLREMVEHWKNEHSKLVKQNSHLQSEKLECEEKINSNHKTIEDLSEKLEKSGENEKIQLESLKIANGKLLSQNQNLKIQNDCFEREFIELTQKSIKIGLEMGDEIEVLKNYKNKIVDDYKTLQSSESLLKMKLAKFQNENEAVISYIFLFIFCIGINLNF